MPQVTGPITTTDPNDTYSTGDGNRSSLGFKAVNSVAEMLAIPLARRKGNYDPNTPTASPKPTFCAVRTGTGLNATVTIYWLKNEPGTPATTLADWEVYTPTAADPFQGFFIPNEGKDTDGNTIENGTGTKGHYYIANTAGTFNGETYAQYDKAVYDGADWKKVGGGSAVADWTTMTNKPTEFTPVAHNHTIPEVTGLQTELNNKVNTSAVTGDISAAQDTKIPNVIAVKNYAYSKEQVNTQIAQLSTYGTKYTWADATEMAAQTGMSLYDQGVRNDTRKVYKWNGTAWVYHFDLDADNIGIASVDGLQTKLAELDGIGADLTERVEAIEEQIGPATLTTTAQTITEAINEVNANLSGGSYTFDTTPTAGSTNPVTSGGIKTYVDSKADNPEPFTALTIGATTTWATGGKYINNRILTLTQNTTLSITGLVNAAEGSLVLIQDATGSRTVTFPAGSLPTAPTINTAANGITFLGWKYDGTRLFWTYKSY